ncbi:HSP20-like chaperone [Trichoderma aethiopicum]
MAFFSPYTFYPTESSSSSSAASFTPLFRLLDDYDTYSRQQTGKSSSSPSTTTTAPSRRQQQHQQLQQQVPQWQPKFDVREVESAYELFGELPGVNKEAVYIEFSDPQTLLIRGRSERTYTAGTSPTQSSNNNNKSVTDKAEEATASSSSRRNSYKATVEDEDEASERESGYEVVTTTTETNNKKKNKSEEKKPVDKAKYWLTERSIGEFSRSFHFPTLVDHEAVSASFRNGILSIVVPKAKKHEAHRIQIN